MSLQEQDEAKIVARALGLDKIAYSFVPTGPRSKFRTLFPLLLSALRDLPEPRLSLERRVEALENEVFELRKKMGLIREPTEADMIYEELREELEKEYSGKIVAIDVESKAIVGIGDSILEAFKDAKEKTSKSKFAYKRVGYASVYKLR